VSTPGRLESLLSLAEKEPDNSFVRYGLAMEYARLNRTEEALQTYRDLLLREPLYVPAYFQLGTLLAKCGRIEEAQQTYSEGIKVASQKADWHTKSELESALENL
jgi:tetratricopeptide (TPR) repeat protein